MVSLFPTNHSPPVGVPFLWVFLTLSNHSSNPLSREGRTWVVNFSLSCGKEEEEEEEEG